MRILYLSSVLPTLSETFVSGEVLGLRDRGVRVDVASLYPPETDLGDERLAGLARQAVPVYGAGAAALVRDALRMACRKPLRSLSVGACAARDALCADDIGLVGRGKLGVQALAGLALAGRVRKQGVTHLHAHMAHSATSVGMYAARALGIPFSFTGHAADLFRERCLLREKLQRSAFVACISRWHREWYSEIVARADADYPIVRCGVDVPEAPADPGRSTRLRVLALGRLVPKKGFDRLIRAVAWLQREAPEVELELTVAGDGPESEALARLAEQEGVEASFLGRVQHAQVPGLMRAADVIALPCLQARDGDRDGIPVVLMEAMALGLCVVSGDLPTIRELVEHDRTGLMVPPGEVQPLAEALRRLATEPELRARLGAAGRAQVQEEFSRAANLDRLLQGFRRAGAPR